DAKTGRWLSQDPLGLAPDANPYRYVGNNATNLTDPDGLAPNGAGMGARGAADPAAFGQTARMAEDMVDPAMGRKMREAYAWMARFAELIREGLSGPDILAEIGVPEGAQDSGAIETIMMINIGEGIPALIDDSSMEDAMYWNEVVSALLGEGMNI